MNPYTPTIAQTANAVERARTHIGKAHTHLVRAQIIVEAARPLFGEHGVWRDEPQASSIADELAFVGGLITTERDRLGIADTRLNIAHEYAADAARLSTDERACPTDDAE